MYKTIISHFYNEEYLLPWWLEHHKKYFNHGIMINYASTDNSVSIIKQICPDWTAIEYIGRADKLQSYKGFSRTIGSLNIYLEYAKRSYCCWLN